ncbi:MAG: hypothetical protein WBB23_14295 [Desulforhopalus sp.]
MLLETMTISRRFCGPSKSGNGGYVCGRIARHISGSATVRLFSPPPLETELRIESIDGVVKLLHGSELVGEGRNTELDLTPPVSPLFSEAKEASKSYLGFTSHNFPRCFVCGPLRENGDGMRIFAGSLKGSSVVAAPWIVDASLVRDSRIPDEFLWAALDCPSGFAVLPVAEGMTIVLGQLSGHIYGSVRASEECVTIGWPIHIEGRKRKSGSAVFSEAGDVVAVGQATWIEVPESAFPAEKAS